MLTGAALDPPPEVCGPSPECVAADVFAAVAASVPAARAWLRTRLRTHGLCERIGGDAELVLSELLSNAILHTRSETVRCRVVCSTGRVRVEVTDGGGRPAGHRARTADDAAEHGRGLRLVEAVSERWGSAPAEHGRGRTVWARLRCG
jgi:anti-sigma regulatory factor (Ser/Thr protein kinase)